MPIIFCIILFIRQDAQLSQKDALQGVLQFSPKVEH